MTGALVHDKRGVLGGLHAGSGAVVELGCGPRKQVPEAIGIDRLDTDAVDVVGDVLGILRSLPERSVARVCSFHFLEHVDDLEGLVDEIARVLDDGGMLEATVPHFSNPYFYSDPTHRRFFGLYTFSYLSEDTVFARQVPKYGRDLQFELVEARLGFQSPFRLTGFFKRNVGRLVNLSRATRELYEENFAFMVPCYEVSYRLRRKPRQRNGTG